MAPIKAIVRFGVRLARRPPGGKAGRRGQAGRPGRALTGPPAAGADGVASGSCGRVTGAKGAGARGATGRAEGAAAGPEGGGIPLLPAGKPPAGAVAAGRSAPSEGAAAGRNAAAWGVGAGRPAGCHPACRGRAGGIPAAGRAAAAAPADEVADGPLRALAPSAGMSAPELSAGRGPLARGPRSCARCAAACDPRLRMRAIVRQSATFAAAGHVQPPWQHPAPPGHGACRRTACRGPERARPWPSRP